MIKTVIVFDVWRHINSMRALIVFSFFQLNVSDTQMKNKVRCAAI